MITVFTPSYNREKELKMLYKSLLEQDYFDFEWLIVDDGSIDNTEIAVKEMINENKINIVYFKQENKGKSKAVNQGIKLAKGEFFLCIDSDDYFIPNVLGTIANEYESIKNEDDIAGLGFLHWKIDSEEVIGTKFPEDVMIDTYFNIYHLHKVKGDKQLIFKTEIMREYLFPEIEDEKFVPEALMFNRISKKYKMKFINKAVVYKNYLENGYSNNYFQLAKRNPKGQVLYYKELYELEPTLYNVAAYEMYSIFSKKGFFKMINEHPSKFKAVLMFFPALYKAKTKK